MSLRNRTSAPVWREVTPSRPCVICQKPDYCSRSEDDRWAVCRRLPSHPAYGTGKEKTDQAGATYWAYRLGPPPDPSESWPTPRFSHTDGGGKRAGPDELHRVYSAFLARLPLSGGHAEALTRRGLNGGHKAAGYRTLGKDRARAALALVKADMEESLPRVPGFYVQEKDGRRFWSVVGRGGLLIPVRDVRRRIVRLLVRPDGASGKGKYRWVSSRRKGGAPSGNHIHVPLFNGDTATVRITEGALKADVATRLSGLLTIGLPGVNGKRPAAEVLRELGAKTARLAFDADARKNPTVGEALRRLATYLQEQGFAVEMERWEEADGKGIDDLLAAGKQPEVLAGDDLQAGLAELAKAVPAAERQPGQGGKAGEARDDPHRLARKHLERCGGSAEGLTLRYWREQWHRWDGRAYRAMPDRELAAALTATVKRVFDEDYQLDLAARAAASEGDKGEPPQVRKVTTRVIGDTTQALQSLTMLPGAMGAPAWLGAPHERREYLSLANGLLDLGAFLAGGEDVLRKHTPEWFSPVSLPYDFDLAATCPRWEAFLQRNLAGNREVIALLQCFAGYLLTFDTSLQKFLLMIGEGSNGKSVICAVLRALLGPENTASVPLEWFGERFHLSETLGKLANVVAEVGELDKIAEGNLKAFVVGDPMLFERKFKSPFTAPPTARLVLSTNNFPAFSDRSDGLWRRMLLLRFTVQIPDAEKLARMDKPEFWQESGELPGILNWALAGLSVLREQGRFVVPNACQDAAEQFRTDANPARKFLQDHYQGGDGALPTRDVYQAYRTWCGENGHHPLADVGFGREVARRFPKVIRAKRATELGRQWHYCGLVQRRDG